MKVSNQLLREFAKVTNDTKKEQSSVYRYGEIHMEGKNAFVKLDGSDEMTPVDTSCHVDTGDRVMVLIGNHTATVTDNITNPGAGSKEVEQVTNFIANNLTAEHLDAKYATVQNLEAVSEKVGSIEAGQITTEQLDAKYAKIENLNATNERVGNLEATSVTTEQLEASNGRITKLESDTVKTVDLEANYTKTKDLDAKYAQLDMTNVNEGSITQALIAEGAIGTVQIADGSITDAKIVTLNAGKITAGTLDASKVTVTNLNADNIVTGTLNGVRLKDSTITLEKFADGVKDTIVSDAVEQADTNADAKINTVGKITFHSGTSDIVGTNENDVLYDTSNGMKRYKWNGSKWIDASFDADQCIVTGSITAGLIDAESVKVNAALIGAIFAGTVDASGTVAFGRELKAASGLFSVNSEGYLTTKSGNIAGFDISDGKLGKGTFGSADSVYLFPKDQDSNVTIGTYSRKDWRFAAGTGFGVTKDGAMYASSGNIGGTNGISFSGSKVTLGSNCEIAWNSVTGTGTVITEDTLKTVNLTATNLKVKSANIEGKITANQINTTGLIAENIRATTISGKTISGCTISGGKITAIGGSIGGFNIVNPTNGSKPYLGYGTYNENGSITILPQGGHGGDGSTGDWVLTVGSSFKVTSNGKVYASGASISGSISANSGNFGNLHIGEGHISSGRLFLSDSKISVGTFADGSNDVIITPGKIRVIEDSQSGNEITITGKGINGNCFSATHAAKASSLDGNAKSADDTVARPVVTSNDSSRYVGSLASRNTNEFLINAKWEESSFGWAVIKVTRSDIRLKKNIRDTEIRDALSIINRLKLRSFDWKSTNAHQKIGFIADEMEQIDSAFSFGGEIEEDGVTCYKCVDTFYLMGYLTKAIQELSAQLEQLKEEKSK